MIIITGQIIEFVHVKRVALVCYDLKHPSFVSVPLPFRCRLNQILNESLIQIVIFYVQVIVIYHIVEKEAGCTLMGPIIDILRCPTFQ